MSTVGDLAEELDLVATGELEGIRGWEPIPGYQPTSPRPIWRTVFFNISGEIAVVTTSLSPPTSPFEQMVDPTTCASESTTACSSVVTDTDADGVELLVLASAEGVEGLADGLRSTTAGNARIRATEFEPLAELALSATRRQLFVPEDDSDWTLLQTLAHASGSPVSEPALVMVQRDPPSIGTISSGVVVRLLPLGSRPVTAEAIDETHTVVVIEKSGVLVELVGWNHEIAELETIASLISIEDEGFQYASRAATSIGIERRYEITYSQPFPQPILEGPVFGAEVANDRNVSSTIRVSRVPNYVPSAAVVLPHDNERVVVPVRGTSGSLIVNAGRASLTWQETEGTLIRLEGRTEAQLLALAESLEAVTLEELLER